MACKAYECHRIFSIDPAYGSENGKTWICGQAGELFLWDERTNGCLGNITTRMARRGKARQGTEANNTLHMICIPR